MSRDRPRRGGPAGEPPLRFAFEVVNTESVTGELVDAGAELLAPPTVKPWHSLNSMLQAHRDRQITLFQEHDTVA